MKDKIRCWLCTVEFDGYSKRRKWIIIAEDGAGRVGDFTFIGVIVWLWRNR